jgi:hypothetical protein
MLFIRVVHGTVKRPNFDTFFRTNIFSEICFGSPLKKFFEGMSKVSTAGVELSNLVT